MGLDEIKISHLIFWLSTQRLAVRSTLSLLCQQLAERLQIRYNYLYICFDATALRFDASLSGLAEFTFTSGATHSGKCVTTKL